MMPNPTYNYPDLNQHFTEANKVLVEENKRLRLADTKLASAALRVISEYDGTHRLALAVSEWSKVLADEHGRGDTFNDN